jgi:uncharacterized protein
MMGPSMSRLTLQSLPLFPLGTVLYPGGLLPLRIFEVRYLDMISRCHKAGAPFGVVCLSRGREVRQPGAEDEAFADVGTLATIERLAAPQPGLLHVQARGGQRFRLQGTHRMKHGLWVADVECIPDDRPLPIPEDLAPAAQALGRVLATLQAQLGEGEEMPVEDPWHLDDCAWVANRWCELLPLDPQLKQRLMALDNPLLRLELVSDTLGRLGIETG